MRLDGELSELEGALLARHLESCPACLAFDARLSSAARTLRLTQAESPAHPIAIPSQHRRRVPALSGRRVAVVAIAAALALGSLVGSQLHRPASGPSNHEPQFSQLTRSDINQLRQLPRGKHVAPAQPAHIPGQPPEGLI
jgi:predicted anti-sigma-YlaC factor YlaD